MFWGLILKANKKYTQKLEKPFHLSQAALDHSSSDDEPVQVMYSHENSSYLLCTLQKGKNIQCALDLNFAEGDELCFLTKGNGIVHLTGFLVPEEDFNYGEYDSEEEDDESEIETPDLREKLNKNKAIDKKSVKKQQQIKESNDDEDDSDEIDDEDDEELDISGLNEDDDEEDDESVDEDDESESEEEEVAPPKPKQQKLDASGKDKKKDKKQQNGTTNGQEKKNLQKDEKPGQVRKLQGGLECQDLKIGGGAEAKVGKKIQVYYEGRLKNNNKVFDATKSGPGFKMTLGRGEVIKGWDIGLIGMKVGGKRRLICPPSLAYGQKGNPPVIPANSTLVFDVELKNVL
ncbi:46 kDa FK506-binding nuclear protein isoform X2 [Chironomus tepperi]|uniref:46 kDa FK506-binding nuclear protein isoform X2 n=1 Tax=Chironomus tepperi TaxID=113505 RepID=UPI00391F53B2